MADGRLVDRFSGPVSGDDGSRYGRIWTFRDITERVRLERRLADQLGFQQALLDTLPYAVFYKGPDTRFVGCNRAYEQAFGVQREHFIGKRVLDLEYLPLEDRLAFQAEDEATIASIGLVRREKPIPFQDGTLHQTLYSVSGFRQTDGSPGGLIGVIVDITDRKMAEERFSLIFEMAPECIFFVRTADWSSSTPTPPSRSYPDTGAKRLWAGTCLRWACGTIWRSAPSSTAILTLMAK
jgi:two-component system sensor histidine kinase/response regulator